VFDPALRERHIGDLQGLTLQDAAKEKPEAYKAFMSHKRNRQIPVSIHVFLLLSKFSELVLVRCPNIVLSNIAKTWCGL
jgi:hypothetical protein